MARERDQETAVGPAGDQDDAAAPQDRQPPRTEGERADVAGPAPSAARAEGSPADAPASGEGGDEASGKGKGKASAKGKEAGARSGRAARADSPRATAARSRAPERADTRTATRKPAKSRRPAENAAPDAGAPVKDAASETRAKAPSSAKALQSEPAPRPPAVTRADAPADAGGEPFASPSLPARLAENIERIESLSRRLAVALGQRPLRSPGVDAPGPEFFATAAQAWLKLATQQPARILEQQVQYWGDTLRHVAEAQQAFVLSGFAAPADDSPSDRRFANPLWHTNPFYSFVRRQYQINADAMRKATADLEIDDEVDRRRIDWFSRQIIDMLSPTNFLATNPDALEKALETEGESLVQGLENLVRDIEAGGGELVVSLADREAFSVGENIGTAPGDVVHRTSMYELIQYAPSTEQVHATPVVVFPPWINKFYILDLRPQNSLLRWLVGQGYTVFVVSWKNPDAEHADMGMGDYVSSYLEVIDRVLELTDQPQLNAVGYCIAGTTLSLTLGLMKQRGDERVKSATFFTTLTDFSDQGEFTTFLQDDFVGGIEDEVSRKGYLSAQLMQRTFSFLRANDLVWGPAIRSYMLGEAPPAFDLLYWNGDSTNLPGRMVREYLRGLCQRNALMDRGFPVHGHMVKLSDVTVPVCSIACEGDHIAPWMHCWQGVAHMGSADKTFILSESGHIAGIINPPGRIKYGHYISDAGFGGTAEEWRAVAQHTEGSWWPHWQEWLAEQAGPMLPARHAEQSLGPAPGTYVHEKA